MIFWSRLTPNHRHLTRQDGGGDKPQADLTHLFAKPRHFFVCDRQGGFWGHVAFGWAGAYGSIYRIDPTANIDILLMIQLLPMNTDLGQRYPATVHQAYLGGAAERANPTN